MQIPIDIKVLKSVLSIDDKAAQQIIDKTKRVRIDEDTPIVPKKPDNQTIAVEAPTNLGDGLLVIELINEHGGTTITLAYDLKEKNFRQQEEDEEDEED